MGACKDVSALHPQDAVLSTAAMFEETSLSVLPVVNEQNMLIGTLDKAAFLQVPAKKTLWDKLTR